MISFFFFFFSSRRRHTRSLCDWSSDVCSSDLRRRITLSSWPVLGGVEMASSRLRSRLRSEERRVGKSVDLGGRRIIKKKKKKKKKKKEKKKKKKKKKKKNKK